MRHIPIPEHIQILHVEQEIEGTDEEAIRAVLRAVRLLKKKEKNKRKRK